MSRLDDIIIRLSGESFDTAINDIDNYMTVLEVSETIAKQAIKDLMIEVIDEIKEYDDVLYRRLSKKIEEL